MSRASRWTCSPARSGSAARLLDLQAALASSVFRPDPDCQLAGKCGPAAAGCGTTMAASRTAGGRSGEYQTPRATAENQQPHQRPPHRSRRPAEEAIQSLLPAPPPRRTGRPGQRPWPSGRSAAARRDLAIVQGLRLKIAAAGAVPGFVSSSGPRTAPGRSTGSRARPPARRCRCGGRSDPR